jgi:hypothetical protein
MLRRMIIGLVMADAVGAGLTGNALAFSGGVSHVVVHPVPMTRNAVVAMPQTLPLLSACATSLSITPAIVGGYRRHQPSAVSSRSVSGPKHAAHGDNKELQS